MQCLEMQTSIVTVGGHWQIGGCTLSTIQVDSLQPSYSSLLQQSSAPRLEAWHERYRIIGRCVFRGCKAPGIGAGLVRVQQQPQ
eukprot:358772-Chlamydomonas_euryale.AAC.23